LGIASALLMSIIMGIGSRGSLPEGDFPQYTLHPPIRIDSNAGFTPANGVTGGSGTEADPWAIEGWNITGAAHGFCIYIGNTTEHFEIRDCRAHHASGNFVAYYYTESGIIFYNVSNGSVVGTVIDSNDFDGICLYGSDRCTISGNSVSGNEYGITVMDFSENNTVAGNDVRSNEYYGINLIQSGWNIVDGNTVNGTFGNGICISEGAGNHVGNNTITGCENGIDVWDSVRNNIAGNLAVGNVNGIYLEYASQNRIVNNNASANTEFGIRLATSGGNTIFHNTLKNNTLGQARDGSGGNAWDNGYPSGGNHWGGYSGLDANRDGFGDVPYLDILGNMGARDRYPLIQAWFPDITAPAADAGPDAAVDEDVPTAFNGTASHDNVGIVDYSWTFLSGGENVTLAGMCPIHNFTEPGVYSVTLYVKDSAGNQGLDTLSVAVKDVTPPEADAGPDLTVCLEGHCDFNGSASADNVGIAEYAWTFNDGFADIILSGVLQSHHFLLAGSYPVTLEVKDSSGLADSDTMLVTVMPDTQPPVADAGPDQTVVLSESVRFNGTGSTDDFGISNHTWNLTCNGTAWLLYGPEPAHTFWEPGNHTVTLTVTDAAGNRGTDTMTVSVMSPTNDSDNSSTDDILDSESGHFVWAAAGGIVAVAAIILVAIMILRIRRK